MHVAKLGLSADEKDVTVMDFETFIRTNPLGMDREILLDFQNGYHSLPFNTRIQGILISNNDKPELGRYKIF